MNKQEAAIKIQYPDVAMGIQSDIENWLSNTPQNFDSDNYYFPVVDEDVPPVHHNEVKPMDVRKTYNAET